MDFENTGEELTPEQLEAAKADIRNAVENPDDGKEVTLPSETSNEEDKVFANKFNSVDELKKGIDNLGSELPEYVLAGMSDDALEQHYVELQKEFSSRKKDEPEKKAEKTEKPSENISDELWSDLESTFAENGDITQEQRDQLDKSGIPKQVVDQYIKGLNAEQQMFTNEVYKIAGGEAEYEAIKTWAEENYSQAELDVVASGTSAEILMKYKAVKADYMEANGGVVKTTDRLRGGSNTGTQGYNSPEEYMLDRASKEWKTPKGRARIEAKFKASSFGG